MLMIIKLLHPNHLDLNLNSCTTRNECVPPTGPGGESPQVAIGQQTGSGSGNGIGIGIGNVNGVGSARPGNSQLDSNSARQLKWISNDSASNGKCIDLQSIVPDRIPLTSTGKVSHTNTNLKTCRANRRYFRMLIGCDDPLREECRRGRNYD